MMGTLVGGIVTFEIMVRLYLEDCIYLNYNYD